MITPVQCGTCGPKQALNIERPQGPQMTSFKGGEKVIKEGIEAAGEAAQKSGIFKSIFKFIKEIPAKISGKIGPFFTTEGKGFRKFLTGAKGVIDNVLTFLKSIGKKAPEAAAEVAEIVNKV